MFPDGYSLFEVNESQTAFDPTPFLVHVVYTCTYMYVSCTLANSKSAVVEQFPYCLPQMVSQALRASSWISSSFLTLYAPGHRAGPTANWAIHLWNGFG